ncbi:MAG: FHA domain-containing protein [Luteolibacter sp.]
MPRILLHVPGYAPQPYRFPLYQEVLTLGRAEGNDMILDCGSVSSMHAEIRRVPGGFQLRDLNSTNGITLDGYREEVIDLRPGADVKLGDVGLSYEYEEGEAESLLLEMEQLKTPVGAAAVPVEAPPVAPVRPAPPVAERPQVIYVKESSGNGWKVLFVVLLVGAFCTGLALRFHKDTGGSWVDSVRKHFFEPEVKVPSPAPSSEAR